VSVTENPNTSQPEKRKSKPPPATDILLKKRPAKGDADHSEFATQTARDRQLASETFQRYDRERAGYLDCKRASMAMVDLQIKLNEEEVKSIIAQYEEECASGSTADEQMGRIAKDKVRKTLE
jgi:hypothetical protein